MIKINLIFDKKAIERAKVKHQLVIGVIVMFITIGVDGFWWYSQSNIIKDFNNNINDSKTKLDNLKAVINKIADKEKKKKRLEDIIKAIGELKGIQKGPARILDDINTMMPSEIWLTSMAETGGQIVIDGYSFSNPGIAVFMENLKTSKYFSNVELFDIQQTMIEGDKVKKFTLIAIAAPGKKLEEKPKEAANKVGGT